MKLTEQKCVACEGGVPPLKGEELQKLHKDVSDWTIVEEHHLEKEFTFKDFKEAQAFTNKVGDLAEQLGHHPDILLSWGKVKVTIFTHKIDGLHINDFILAAKTNEL